MIFRKSIFEKLQEKQAFNLIGLKKETEMLWKNLPEEEKNLFKQEWEKEK